MLVEKFEIVDIGRRNREESVVVLVYHAMVTVSSSLAKKIKQYSREASTKHA
jgi:hypothetical protein